MMSEVTPEIGKEYRVRHSRKGVFCIRVTAIAPPWIDGVITSGTAGAILPHNERYVGETITIHDIHSTFSPLT
jgi:hypothetical protein